MTPVEIKWLRFDDGARLLALREQTIRQVLSLEPRGVATVARTLAKLAPPGAAWGSLWRGLEGAALACISKFDPQGLPNTAWSFATARQASPALLDAIAAESAGRVRGFKPQERPIRRGPTPRLAMHPRRSSMRLRRSLHGGYAI